MFTYFHVPYRYYAFYDKVWQKNATYFVQLECYWIIEPLFVTTLISCHELQCIWQHISILEPVVIFIAMHSAYIFVLYYYDANQRYDDSMSQMCLTVNHVPIAYQQEKQ